MANPTNKGLTLPAFLALGAAVYGAMQYKKAAKTGGKFLGFDTAPKSASTTPTASGIDVGTGVSSTI